MTHSIDADKAAGAQTQQSGGVAAGPIGQQIGKKLSNQGVGTVGSGSAIPTPGAGTSSNNWPWGANPVPASTGTGLKSLSYQSAQFAKPQTYTKTKVRYVVVDKDEATLELKELSTITPEEMIGISKFLSLVTTYTVIVLGQSIVGYNFNINWTEVINDLGIRRHFAPGSPLVDYDHDASDVLDILLYDPQ